MILKTSIGKLLTSKPKYISLVNSHTPKYRYTQKDQRFLRFIDLDAKYLSEIPWIFTPLKPYIHFVRDSVYQFNQIVGLPWWVIVLLTSVIARATIFPLIFIQMKKVSRIGPVWPIFAFIKQTWKDSNLTLFQKVKLSWSLYRKLAHQQNFRLRSVFVYNLAYYPILISMVFSLRSLFSIEAVAQSGFLYLNSLAQIDPYYILPTLTVASYYWNFERFITPQNKYTLISRMRALCQVLLIIWYPFLCCWPSGIVLYMFCNSIISILQASLMKSVWFQSKLNKKVMHYNYMLSTVQYDKGTSDSIIQAIKTGEQSLKQKSIKEHIIVSQTEEMVKKLNKELQEKDKQEQEQKLPQNKNDKKLSDKKLDSDVKGQTDKIQKKK